MLTGNKGEWSEIYAFSYILDKGYLQAADKDLNPIDETVFPVLEIIRVDNGTERHYQTSDKDELPILCNGEIIGTIKRNELQETIRSLLINIPNGKRAFSIPDVEPFFQTAMIERLKAYSMQKEDIRLQIHDIHNGTSPICGFSIKSYLGSNPTLINAGKNTNWTYKIENCTDEIMETVNAINTSTKLKDRMHCLAENGCHLSFDGMNSNKLAENIQFIDTLMPEILAEMLLAFYVMDKTTTSEIVSAVMEQNLLHYSNARMYEYKMKKFLCACALGLTPEKDWNGEEDANGGYICVKSNGDVVCYHIYNRTDFEKYLLDYTYFEKASSSRHQYMSVYKEQDSFYIKLNLQIRFQK